MAPRFEIVRYNSAEWRSRWDAFVAASRNATFLHLRDYMDYHADRFADRSYLALKSGKPVALLPANFDADTATLHSHQGLTYGGWLLPPRHLDGADLLEIFEGACHVWRSEGIKELTYKSIPFIYHSTPSLEDEYALFRLGATRYRTDLSMAIDLRNPPAFSTLRKRSLKKCAALPLALGETTDVAPFHALLTACLAERHAATPVHSLVELELLRVRFPQNIRIFTATLHSELLAAVCIFDTGLVAHAQYICTSAAGREVDALTPLFHHLITDVFANRRYFDFGTCNEDQGRYLNATLLRHKASFGASGVTHQHYVIDFRF